jgi:aerobic C4-dicarboxylate transport protein
VHGIASMEDMKKVGRVGLKAIVYFEVVTTLALVVGLIVANLWQPGAGMNVDPSTIDAKSVQQYAAKAHEQSAIDYVTHIIPSAVVGAFAEGEILQVLFFSLLFAFALSFLGERGKPLLRIIDLVSHTFFGVVAIIMRAAPIGAFGAMAFTIGRYGVGTLLSLGHLMASVYATCLIFIFIVLGGIARLCGFSILKFIRYIKEELLIVLGTSSSESVLPRMIAKLENLGCQESVVGLVIPTGYSFNLDGTCIYLTMATLFLAQATNTELTLARQLGIMGVLLLTSKGAAGVTGSGFIVLALGRYDPGGEHRADPRRRPLHVRGARFDQPDRQRSGDRGGRQVGGRARRGAHARSSRPGDDGGSGRTGEGAARSRTARTVVATPTLAPVIAEDWDVGLHHIAYSGGVSGPGARHSAFGDTLG